MAGTFSKIVDHDGKTSTTTDMTITIKTTTTTIKLTTTRTVTTTMATTTTMTTTIVELRVGIEVLWLQAK